ncbi:hypothetical protein M0802_015472 [Mischocyttarus mexicanus]|nr:hypothetical protein M0802_015472 [Mischocyttarus mexicanus]
MKEKTETKIDKKESEIERSGPKFPAKVSQVSR